jgi:hypothetical protein
MANRRMFSNRIAKSAKFLQMPLEAQALYFHLILNADDDGVVETYPIIKMLSTADDIIKILLVKKFLIQLNEDQVMLISDWLEHNSIRADRKIDSLYKHLIPESTPLIEAKPRSDVKDNSKRTDSGLSTDGLGKVKLGKVKLIKDKKKTEQSSEWVSLENAIKKLEDNPRRELNIIALYFEERKPDLQNKDQYQIAVRRHLRAAIQLKPFTNDQILKGLKRAKESTPDYTLETIVKMLTK